MTGQNDLLLITVVRRGRGDRVVEIALSAGAAGSTVLFGRGTAKNRFLDLLFLGGAEKELVFTVASGQIMQAIITALRNAPDLCKKIPGIGFTIDVGHFWHSGEKMNDAEWRQSMSENERQLICVIANEGFSDDIMNAARHAGAKGGTIIHARGTAGKEESSFFGITIVPEKEMVLVLAKNSEAGPIIAAIKNCPCLAEPGAGILFCMPVVSFFPLGASASK